MQKLKVIISGGGTGGHIFPAISIANALEKKIDNIEILFVGAKGKMEMEKIPDLGYNIKGLSVIGFQRRFDLRNFLFPFKLVHSLINSYFIIKKFKPDIVIGTGGYASGPILYISSIFGIPSIIQEQNSYPGITNKILSSHVDKICVAYDGMDKYFKSEKLVLTGNPIRKDILAFKGKINNGISLFKLNQKNKTILVIGGSLGAKTINNSILNDLNLFKEKKINLIWQTGNSFKNIAENRIKSFKCSNINAYSFIKEMDLAYSVADIIVSRAGAIAISELCCVGKPVILVPSPNVSENHQYLNAQSLVDKKAALLVRDVNANRKLVKLMIDLVDNIDLQSELSTNIKSLSIVDAAEKIAKISIDLKNGKKLKKI